MSMTVMSHIMVIGCKVKFNFDLPQGSRMVRWFMDPYRDAVMFVFEHESFPVVEPGEDIPLGPPGTATVEEDDHGRS